MHNKKLFSREFSKHTASNDKENPGRRDRIHFSWDFFSTDVKNLYDKKLGGT